MLNYITPKMARLILAVIRPHLVAFIDVLDHWEQWLKRRFVFDDPFPILFRPNFCLVSGC